MVRTSLVNKLFDKGDEMWVETDEDRVRGTYDRHVISGDSVKFYLENVAPSKRDFYKVSDSNLHEGNDFGLEGCEEGFYQSIQDYGMDGEKVPDLMREAANIHGLEELSNLAGSYEEKSLKAD